MRINQNLKTFIILLSIVGVITTLYFGLRFKSWPSLNDATLLQEQNGIYFHGFGLAYVSDLDTPGTQISDEFTITLSAAPDNILKSGYKPLLVISDGDDRKQLAIWHWGASLIVMNGNDYEHRKKVPRLIAPESLVPEVTRFITITSNKLGTSLFIDGSLVDHSNDWHLQIPSSSETVRMILGNSLYGKHGWNGQLFDFAIYDQALSPETVGRLYQASTMEPQSEKNGDGDIQPILHYTFDKLDDNTVPDISGNNIHLQVPPKLTALKKQFLTPPWQTFKLNRSLFIDVTINLIGFILLGSLLYTCLITCFPQPKSAMILYTIAFCFLLSLCIETLQVWLPGRDSSLLDLILNTLGATLGTLLIKHGVRS